MSEFKRRLAVAVLSMAALAACRDTGGEGQYFEVTGKLFVFNYRVATATYLVTLGPLQPVGEGETAVVTFEDPAGGAPILVRQKIWPKLAKTTIESPPLECVAKGIPYAVSIVIEGREGQVMQTIETTMTSSEDQSLLPDRPLVVGPVYTPNPDLVGVRTGNWRAVVERSVRIGRPGLNNRRFQHTNFLVLYGNQTYNCGKEIVMAQDTHRTARLEARIAPEALAIVKRAAEMEGRSLSDFIVLAAQEAARRTIEENNVIRLSVGDQQRFVDLLLNPPDSSAALRRAKAAHDDLILKSQ